MSQQPRCAIYCRLSKEDAQKQGVSESIANQQALLLAHAAHEGWRVYDIYCDEDYSGVDRERPRFCQLLQDAEAGNFEIVLCKTQSRFTRDMELVERYIHGLFVQWGIRFIALLDHADSELKGNKKARQINGLINEWYLEDLSENIRAVFDQKRRSGHYIASFALYGYRKDPEHPGQLLVDEAAAAVVRKIYRWYDQGMGINAIAARLTEQGIPNPTAYKRRQGQDYRNGTSSAWNKTTVGRILKNEMYCGTLVQGRRRKLSYKSSSFIELPPEQWIKVVDHHQPLVSQQLFQKVQAKLADKKRASDF